jgi:hypothetical protein
MTVTAMIVTGMTVTDMTFRGDRCQFSLGTSRKEDVQNK